MASRISRLQLVNCYYRRKRAVDPLMASMVGFIYIWDCVSGELEFPSVQDQNWFTAANQSALLIADRDHSSPCSQRHSKYSVVSEDHASDDQIMGGGCVHGRCCHGTESKHVGKMYDSLPNTGKLEGHVLTTHHDQVVVTAMTARDSAHALQSATLPSIHTFSLSHQHPLINPCFLCKHHS